MNNHQRRTVIIVEAETPSNNNLVIKIKKLGYNAIKVNTIDAALELLSAGWIFSLILMDIDLIKLDKDIEGTKRLSKASNIPMIFLISRLEKGFQTELNNIPNYGYLYKNSLNCVIETSFESAIELFETRRITKMQDSLFETIPYGIVCQNKHGEIICANKSAERILGLTVNQMRGWDSFNPKWKAIYANGSNFNGDLHPAMVALKTGKVIKNTTMGIFNIEINEYVWISVSAVPQFRYGEEEPYQVYTTFEDITKHRKEGKLLQKLVQAVEQSPVSVIITDTKGIIEYINPKFLELTGYSKTEVIGKSPSLLKSGKTAVTEYKEMWDTIKAGKEWRGIFLNKKKNGESYWESATIAPVINEAGLVTNFIAVKEDVTLIKQAEEVLKRSNDVLEKLVSQRTHELLITQDATIDSMAILSEFRDNETGAHIQRTKMYVKLLLEKLGEKIPYSKSDIEKIWNSAALHDIGKVAIPDSILLKPGKLTQEEFEVMKKHTFSASI